MQSDFTIEYKNQKEIYEKLTTQIKDFFSRNHFKKAVLGLSGGLDSTICATALADALGAQNVIGISLPSRITPQTSNSDAKQLAENLGINYQIIPIAPVVSQLNTELAPAFENINKNFEKAAQSFTQDNLQARTRATVLYAVSNEFSSVLPVSTSDKSEIYMGYGTLNGDLSGAIAPLADITKTELFALGYWLNKSREKKNAIPISILQKRPSAELAIDEKTNKPLCAEDALMPYEFIDEIIHLIENHKLDEQSIRLANLSYTKKYGTAEEEKQKWLDKFFYRVKTQHFKLVLLPPAICVHENSYLKHCHKIYSEI